MAPMDIQSLRTGLIQWEKDLVQMLGPLDPNLEEFYDKIPLPGGHENPLKIVRPKSTPPTGRPLIVLFHGGGFGAGTVEQPTRPARDFALEFNAVVVAATYRLTPEHKFPMQIHDAWDTLKWVAENASARFGAQADQAFIVGGFSAGGNLAAALSQLAVDRKLEPRLTGTFLSIPHLLTEDIVPKKFRGEWTSRKENTEGPLNLENINDIIKNLEPDTKSSLFSPLNSPSIGSLPPTYIQVGGMDPLRDDGIIYEKILRENGVSTRIDNYPELKHEGWTIWANEESPRDLAPRTLRAMSWLLGREG